MLRHNLLLIYRNFKRFKSTFFINLIGLSTGLACALLIYMWVNNELNIDKFHEKDNQLYQVILHNVTANGIEVETEMPPILAETLAEEMPEVEYAVTEVLIPLKNKIALDEKALKASGVYAGKDYFNTFSYKLLQGDKINVLADENNIVISEDLAMKLFNSTENVVGRTIDFEQSEQFLISGIYSIPPQSSKTFDFILPEKVIFKHFPNLKNDWTSNFMFDTYLVLKAGSKIDEFNLKIKDIIKAKSEQENRTISITPYSKRYLYGKYENGVQSGGRIEYVKLFSIIAVFILLIGCINFMNLSTAKATRRIKEVGVKKAIGAGRKSLIIQFLGESILIVTISLITAIVLVEIFLSQFNHITENNLILSYDVNFIFTCLGIILITGLLAGSYPALYISGFSPVTILKGKINNSLGEVWARKGLVVFQFTLSIILMVAVLVVYKQLELIQNKNLGFEKNNIIYFEMEKEIKENEEAFLTGIKNISGIQNASSTFMKFLGDINSTSDISWEGKPLELNAQMQYRRVNYDMIELLEIEMKEGRAFSRDFKSDDSTIIFNEAAIELMGIKDPVGKRVQLFGRDLEIVGVTKNFHFESLHENIKPVFFFLSPERTNTIMVKIAPENLNATISQLGEYYDDFTQGLPFEFTYLDEVYQKQYAAEQRVASLSKYFAGIAIMISCLGLFGLAAFTAERRIKEIGIRKVMGSSEFAIIRLLSEDFTKMVVIAICIGLPMSYFIAKNWLENFAFKIDLEWWYFLSAGLLALLVAWLTVGMQAVKASRINPVNSLKDE